MSAVRPAGEGNPLRVPPLSRGMQIFALCVVFVLGGGLSALLVVDPLGLWSDGTPAAAGSGEAAGSGSASPSDAAAHRAEVPIYQCPMHPEVLQDHPGNCPICGMDLVLRDDQPGASESGDRPGTVRIDPSQVQNTGVVSVPVIEDDISRYSRTVGILDFNADDITWINVKFKGWIEKVHVNYVGQEVSRGQPLFEIYSPELVTTQEEYIRALAYQESLEEGGRAVAMRQAESLVRSTRERLRNWDVDEGQIQALEKTRTPQRRLTVKSPSGGMVAELMNEALEGLYVQPGMNLYKIAKLSSVWVHADVYEADIPWIREGQPAEVSFRNDPEQRFQGRVLFLYPEVSRETRTLKVCVEVPNHERRLRPGMYADVIIHGPTVRSVVVVPQSAVLRSGQRDLVFVDLGEGRFEPREIRLGVQGDDDRIEVVRGLTAGERVVTQAQFMLDSESRIQEAIERFREHRH